MGMTTETDIFDLKVMTFPSIFVATKASILSQNMIFFLLLPYKVEQSQQS